MAPFLSRNVRRAFARIDLHLVLKSGDRPITIDHERCRDGAAAVDYTLGAEYDGDVRFSRCARNG